METRTRDNIHRPSAVRTEDYEYVGIQFMKCEEIGDQIFLREENERIHAHREMTGGTFSRHDHGGTCHICGAHAVYLAVFFHGPTREYIVTGFDCAEKMQQGLDGLFRTFRTKVADIRERKAGIAKARLLLEEAGQGRGQEPNRVGRQTGQQPQRLSSLIVYSIRFSYFPTPIIRSARFAAVTSKVGPCAE